MTEELKIDALGDRIAELSADIDAAMCRWLELVAEFDRREGWAQAGAKTCAQWISWRCGISPGAAREHVRVARRLADLPLVRAAFARAELTYSKVRAITRIEDVSREEGLVEMAGEATAAQLEQIVRGYRRSVDVESGAEESFASRHLYCDWADDGSLVVRGRLPAEQGALLMKALEEAADELRGRPERGPAGARDGSDVPAGTPADRVGAAAETAEAAEYAQSADSAAARRADALVHVADTALAAGSGATSTGGDRYQLVVHLDADGACEAEGCGPIPQATALRLACDAAVVPVTTRGGKPLSVGRKTRTIPPALRRALRSRDGGCRFPGCAHTRHVDAHHIHHWAHGGETSMGNLVQLCRRHHRLLHEGAFGISGPPERLVFRTPSGRRLAPGPFDNWTGPAPLGRVPAGTPPEPPIHPLDLGLAVDAMFAFARPG